MELSEAQRRAEEDGTHLRDRTRGLVRQVIGWTGAVIVALIFTGWIASLVLSGGTDSRPPYASPSDVSRMAAPPARPKCDRVLHRIPVGRTAIPVNEGVPCAITVEYCSGAVIFGGPQGDSPVRWPGAPSIRTGQPWETVRAVREPAEIIYILHPLGTSAIDPVC